MIEGGIGERLFQFQPQESTVCVGIGVNHVVEDGGGDGPGGG